MNKTKTIKHWKNNHQRMIKNNRSWVNLRVKTKFLRILKQSHCIHPFNLKAKAMKILKLWIRLKILLKFIIFKNKKILKIILNSIMIKALWLKNLNWIKENNQNKRKKPFSLYLKKQIQIYLKYPKQMSIKMRKILQDY